MFVVCKKCWRNQGERHQPVSFVHLPKLARLLAYGDVARIIEIFKFEHFRKFNVFQRLGDRPLDETALRATLGTRSELAQIIELRIEAHGYCLRAIEFCAASPCQCHFSESRGLTASAFSITARVALQYT
ncbi:hypothetical protein ATE71_12375 [Sphingopyxis sp. H115]|nr:hypothetical protein ATE71_12375 [Sphingopyxis sp. H115]